MRYELLYERPKGSGSFVSFEPPVFIDADSIEEAEVAVLAKQAESGLLCAAQAAN